MNIILCEPATDLIAEYQLWCLLSWEDCYVTVICGHFVSLQLLQGVQNSLC